MSSLGIRLRGMVLVALLGTMGSLCLVLLACSRVGFDPPPQACENLDCGPSKHCQQDSEGSVQCRCLPGSYEDEDGECVAGCDQNQDCAYLNDPQSPCQQGLCLEGRCLKRAADNGSLCDDHDVCTDQDSCQGGVCLGGVRDCDDGFDCTQDSCAGNQGCLHVVDHGLCQNGLWCDGAENCVQAVGCQAAPQGPCLAPLSCDESLDVCLGCTLDEQCDDFLACTQDSCDQGESRCDFQAQDGLCDDGDACTLDSCDVLLGCQNVLESLPGAEGVNQPGTCTNGLDDDCDGFTDEEDTDSCRLDLEGRTLSNVFPGAGDWNTYWKRSNPDQHFWNQSGPICDGTESGFLSACVHAGEKKFIRPVGLDSCEGISADDVLGVFHWVCRPDGGVGIYLDGLRGGKGLRDLINADGWKQNRLRIYQNGLLIGRTEVEMGWWDNPVAELPADNGMQPLVIDGSGGNVPGTIFWVDQNRDIAGINLDLDGLALVGLNGAVLRYNGVAPDNCNLSTGEEDSPGDRCLVAAGSQKFLWLEVDLDAWNPTDARAEYGVFLSQTRFSQLRNMHLQNAAVHNISLATLVSSFLYDLSIANSGQNNLDLGSGSHHNLIMNLVASHALWRNLNNDASCHTNHFVGCSLLNADWEGLLLQDNDVASHVLAANNIRHGIEVDGSGVTLVQVASLSNGFDGINMSDAGQVVLFDLVLAYNNFYTLSADSEGHRFEGVLKTAGNNLDCHVGASVASGINADCSANGVSSHSLLAGDDPANSFMMDLQRDDVINPDDDGLGLANASADMDWTHFENRQRSWALAVESFPQSGHRGRADTADPVSIFDWRLASLDETLQDRSGDGVVVNQAFVSEAECPPAVHGDWVVQSMALDAQTFLVNAVEVASDSYGDNDGLCETEEVCLYSPHFAIPWQGDGDPFAHLPCDFDDDGISTAVTKAVMRGIP